MLQYIVFHGLDTFGDSVANTFIRQQHYIITTSLVGFLSNMTCTICQLHSMVWVKFRLQV